MKVTYSWLSLVLMQCTINVDTVNAMEVGKARRLEEHGSEDVKDGMTTKSWSSTTTSRAACVDDKDYKFTLPGGRTKGCAWIEKKGNQDDVCLTDYNGTVPADHCLKTCDNCMEDCIDSPTFTFKTWTDTRDCEWLTEKEVRVEKWCDRKGIDDSTEEKVKFGCKKACGMCDDVPTLSPAETPSLSPAETPSPEPPTGTWPCMDNPDHTFKQGKYKCQDLFTLSISTRDKFCAVDWNRNNCRIACEDCCGNNEKFKLKSDGATCEDIRQETNWKKKRYCEKRLVQRNCRAVCDKSCTSDDSDPDPDTDTDPMPKTVLYRIANAGSTNGKRPIISDFWMKDEDGEKIPYSKKNLICSGTKERADSPCENAATGKNWRPQCDDCAAGDAWIGYKVDSKVKVVAAKAVGLGVGEKDGISWDGGVVLEKSRNGGGTWTTLASKAGSNKVAII